MTTHFDCIEGDFWVGELKNCKVILSKSCGYLNATKICLDKQVNLSDWLNSSRELVDHCKIMCHDVQVITPPIKYKTEDGTDVGGVYLHPFLIPHFTAWISPEYSMIIHRLMQNFLVIQENVEVDESETDPFIHTEKLERLQDIKLVMMDDEKKEKELPDMDADHRGL